MNTPIARVSLSRCSSAAKSSEGGAGGCSGADEAAGCFGAAGPAGTAEVAGAVDDGGAVGTGAVEGGFDAGGPGGRATAAAVAGLVLPGVAESGVAAATGLSAAGPGAGVGSKPFGSSAVAGTTLDVDALASGPDSIAGEEAGEAPGGRGATTGVWAGVAFDGLGRRCEQPASEARITRPTTANWRITAPRIPWAHRYGNAVPASMLAASAVRRRIVRIGVTLYGERPVRVGTSVTDSAKGPAAMGHDAPGKEHATNR